MVKTSVKKAFRNDIVINLKDSLQYLKDYLSEKKLNSRIEKAAKSLSKGIKKKKINKLNNRALKKTNSKTKGSPKKDLDQPVVDPTLNVAAEESTLAPKSTANKKADRTKKTATKQADTAHNDIESNKPPASRSKKEKVEK
jgi:hypothetical protein